MKERKIIKQNLKKCSFYLQRVIQQVIELLEEYIRLRNTENIESDIPKDLIKENKKISNAHTYVSAELSKIAGHGKSKIRFKENFFA